MTRTPRRHFLLTVAFATLASTAVVAVAQPGPGTMGNNGPGMMGGGGPGMMGGGGPGMMRGGGPGMMGGDWDTGTYLDGLKTQLAITSNEEPAWKQYADTVSGVGAQMRGLHETMFASMGTASWEERRNLMNQMFQAREQAFATVHEAASKLMADLTPAQQAKAQTILPGLANGRGRMGQRCSGAAARAGCN